MTQHNKGFTLLEVLLALAIAGIALISLQQAQTGQVEIFSKVRYSDMAERIAANKITEYQMLDFWPETNKDIRIETDFGGARWMVTSRFEDTLDIDLKRVNIDVRLQHSRRQHASIEGFILRPPSRRNLVPNGKGDNGSNPDNNNIQNPFGLGANTQNTSASSNGASGGGISNTNNAGSNGSQDVLNNEVEQN